jgi:type IV pilus assembly protein PilO
MEQLIANFKKLTVQQKALILVVAAMLVGAGTYFMSVSADMDRMAELDQRIERQEAELEKLKAQAQHLEQYKREVERLRIRLREAEEQLPKKAEIEKLLRDVAYEAQQSGLQLLRFALSGEVKDKNVARVPVQMRVKGGYHELAVFFDRLSKMPRIVTVSNLSMGKPNLENKKIVLDSAYKLETYRFLATGEGKKGKK